MDEVHEAAAKYHETYMSQHDVMRALRISHGELAELHDKAGLEAPDELGRYSRQKITAWLHAQAGGGATAKRR